MVWWSRTDTAEHQKNQALSPAPAVQTAATSLTPERRDMEGDNPAIVSVSMEQPDLLEHLRTAVKGQLATDDVQIDLADARGMRIQSNSELYQAIAAKDRMPLKAVPSDSSTELTAHGAEQLHELRTQVVNERVTALERRIDVVAEEVAAELQAFRAQLRGVCAGAVGGIPGAEEARLDCLAAEFATEQRLREEVANKVDGMLQIMVALARKSHLGSQWTTKLAFLCEGLTLNGISDSLGHQEPAEEPAGWSEGVLDAATKADLSAELQSIRGEVMACQRGALGFHDELAAMFTSLSADVASTKELHKQQLLRVTEGLNQLGRTFGKRLDAAENHSAAQDQRLVDLDVARSVLTQQLDVQKESVKQQFEKSGDQVNKLKDDVKRLRTQGLDLKRRNDEIMNKVDFLGGRFQQLQQFTAQVEDLVLPMKDQFAQQVEAIRSATEGGVLRQSSAGSSTAVVRQSSAGSTVHFAGLETTPPLTATVTVALHGAQQDSPSSPLLQDTVRSPGTDDSKDEHVSPQMAMQAVDENVYSSARAVDGNVSLASPTGSDRAISRERVTDASPARPMGAGDVAEEHAARNNGVVDDLADTVPITLGQALREEKSPDGVSPTILVANNAVAAERDGSAGPLQRHSVRNSEQKLTRCESQPVVRGLPGTGPRRGQMPAGSPLQVSMGGARPAMSSGVGSGGGGAPFMDHRGSRQLLQAPGAGTPGTPGIAIAHVPARSGTPGHVDRATMPMPVRSREPPQARTLLKPTFGSASTGQLHRPPAHVIPAEVKPLMPSTPGRPVGAVWR
mmetsp:Transcript_60399/g.112125  ORF Transcript_60399/g.112125 Transcript_60399/m.112125 type:complete len:794 (-) Transcript_60399:195-2576(-)